jgi:transketolase
MEISISELESIACKIRGKVVELSHTSGTPHIGSSLSCVDILVAAYWDILSIDPGQPDDPERDRFILSKGHAASALFAALAQRGFFPTHLLDTYATPGSCLEEHPSRNCVQGVEVASGSLGHGLSIGLGILLAGRIQNRTYRVFVLMSDGECNEGSVWEAAMFASGQGVDRLCVIVDFNKWQATGRSCEIMGLEPLKSKWESFGWSTYEIDGHDMGALLRVMSGTPDGSGKPVAVIAHTIKGKGVSFMEDDNNWHYRVPNESEVTKAKKELGLA